MNASSLSAFKTGMKKEKEKKKRREKRKMKGGDLDKEINFAIDPLSRHSISKPSLVDAILLVCIMPF